MNYLSCPRKSNLIIHSILYFLLYHWVSFLSIHLYLYYIIEHSWPFSSCLYNWGWPLISFLCIKYCEFLMSELSQCYKINFACLKALLCFETVYQSEKVCDAWWLIEFVYKTVWTWPLDGTSLVISSIIQDYHFNQEKFLLSFDLIFLLYLKIPLGEKTFCICYCISFHIF